MAFDQYIPLHVAPSSSTLSGVPPLGYRVEDRKLVVIDSEAETVRSIFRRYAQLGSVRSLKEEFDACGINSKAWTSASGRLIGGKPFSRGALYLILQNRTYLGEIVRLPHWPSKKGSVHPTSRGSFASAISLRTSPKPSSTGASHPT